MLSSSNLNIASDKLLIVGLPVAAVGGIAYWVRKTYYEYLDVGPGGFGQHPEGFARCMSVRFLLWWHGVDRLDTSIFEEESRKDPRAWLLPNELPKRDGVRPEVFPFPTPQRHMVYKEDPKLAAQQMEFFEGLAKRYPDKLVYGCSVIEGIGPGMFAHPSIPALKHLTETRREIMHIHLSPFGFKCCTPPKPSTEKLQPGEIRPWHPTYPPPGPQSMHLTLAPKDAKQVIETGWGVRHAASGKPPYPLNSMPAGFVMLYAPETLEELEVYKRVCEACVGFSVGAGDPLIAA